VTDTVDTFRRISWLIAKWSLFGLIGLIVLVCVVIGVAYGYNWFTYDRHVANVQFLISTDQKDCPDDHFPIRVLVGNASSRTVASVSFTLAAREKGRSTNIAEYHSYSDDHILTPRTGWSNCWAVPKLSEQVAKPRDLEWSILYKDVRFQD